MTGRTIFGPLGVSLLAVFALAVVVIAQVPPLISAVFTPGVDQIGLDDRIDLLVGQHKEERATYTARFEGRSAFFEPDPPRNLPTQNNSTPPPPPEPTGAATTYAGPLKAVAVSDRVAFASGTTVFWLREGEERQGVRLVRIDGPFWVTVAWTAPATDRHIYAEGEYQIPVWEWPGGLFTSVPPEPGMASEMVVPAAPSNAGSPRGNPNDPRDMMRRRAEQGERGNRERDSDEDEEEVDEEDAGDDEEVIDEEEEVDDGDAEDDGDPDDAGEAEDDSAEDDESGDGDETDDDGSDEDGEADGADDTASEDDDLEENRR